MQDKSSIKEFEMKEEEKGLDPETIVFFLMFIIVLLIVAIMMIILH